MQLRPTDPDIRTLVARIDEGSIDLQPDFQRGIVWNEAKQQRLVDSILRDWHVPPIHLIKEKGMQVVLDGQQRLHAIHQFVHDKFPIDGSIPPYDVSIHNLNGLYYSKLSKETKYQLDTFPIRVFEISEYQPEEPYELFFRLNQPTVLTSAEKRNAFFGPAREQIRAIVDHAISLGLDQSTVGFSNSRMSYDDAVSRFCVAIEFGTLRRKISAQDVTDKYRSGDPFSFETITRAQHTIQSLLKIPDILAGQIRFNKATFHSWLCLIAANDWMKIPDFQEHLTYYLPAFENMRSLARFTSHEIVSEAPPEPPSSDFTKIAIREAPFLQLFNDRATSRVNDISSVVIRDSILWMVLLMSLPRIRNYSPKLAALHQYSSAAKGGFSENEFTQFLERTSWGDKL